MRSYPFSRPPYWAGEWIVSSSSQHTSHDDGGQWANKSSAYCQALALHKLNLSLFHSERITPYPGELPGYTGWPRQATSLAGSFEIVHPCNVNSIVGTNWTCALLTRSVPSRRLPVLPTSVRSGDPAWIGRRPSKWDVRLYVSTSG
jgi:hypothetical protein